MESQSDNVIRSLTILGFGPSGPSYLKIQTGKDMPGGEQDDPIWAIFFEPGTHESDAADPGLVQVSPSRYLVFTKSVHDKILHGSAQAVVVPEIRTELVIFADREMLLEDASDLVTELLGKPLSELAKRPQPVQVAAAAG